jgi:hypothetical protein
MRPTAWINSNLPAVPSPMHCNTSLLNPAAAHEGPLIKDGNPLKKDDFQVTSSQSNLNRIDAYLYQFNIPLRAYQQKPLPGLVKNLRVVLRYAAWLARRSFES